MQFKDNKFKTIYFAIMERAKTRVLVGYSEGHHIIPKSLGGSNEKDNIVKLTPKEHFIAHHLLVNMTEGKDKSKMVFAFWSMSRRNKHHDQRVTAIFYDRIKRLHSEACVSRNTARVYAKGYKRPQTEASKINIGAANKGRRYFHNPTTGQILAINDDVIPVGFIRGNPKAASGNGGRGTYWAHDPTSKKSMRIPIDQPLPDGYVKGDIKIWITNPTTMHRTFHNRYQELPDGYVKGRLGGTR